MPYCGRAGGPPSTKLSHLPNAYASIGLSKGKREIKDRRIVAVDFAPSGRREFFICQRLAAPSIVAPRGIRGAWRIAVVCANDMGESEGDRSLCAYAQTRSRRASRRCWLRSPRRRRGAQFSALPNPGEIGFLPANGQIAEDMFWFHNWILLPVTIGICLLVLGLIVYIVWRFNETANPVPSRRTHQRRDRNRLDGRARAPARHHRGALVPAARGATHHSRARPDGEGDGLAVALELRLPEIRGRVFVRFALCRGQGPQARPAARHHRRSSRWSFRSARWSKST